MLFIFTTLLAFYTNINSIGISKYISSQNKICSMQYTDTYLYDKSDKHIKLLSREETNNITVNWLSYTFYNKKSLDRSNIDMMNAISYLSTNHSEKNHYLAYTEKPTSLNKEPDYIIFLNVYPNLKQINIEFIYKSPYYKNYLDLSILKNILERICFDTNTYLNFKPLKDLKNRYYYLEFSTIF